MYLRFITFLETGPIQMQDNNQEISAIANGTYARDLRSSSEVAARGIFIGAAVGGFIGILFGWNTLRSAAAGAIGGFIVTRLK